jgi:CelD/BcsL family acetyltransferase involved in cellulose biosynthesis
VEVEEVVSAGALAGHREEWNRLLETAPEAEVFQSYEWLTAWLDAFWRDRPIAFLFVRESGRLRGLAPLLPDTDGEIWCPGSLVLPVNLHATRCEILTAGEPRACLQAVVDHLRRTRGGFRLGWRATDARSPVLAALAEVSGVRRLRTLARPGPVSPVARLRGSWEAYLASRSRHVRHELGRKRRRLEREGGFEIRAFTTPEDWTRAYPELLRIEDASWKRRTSSAISTDPDVARFYAELGRRSAEAGWLRFHLLRLASRPIAHVYGLAFRDRYYALKTSYDQAYADLSPGSVLVGHALRDACQAGLDTFDFLGVESRWKEALADDAVGCSRTCVFTPGMIRCRACALVEGTLKPEIKRRAPGLVALRRRWSGSA